MLGEEYPAFIKSYEESAVRSLRFNPLKGEREDFLEKSPFVLSPVLWEKNGFYFREEDRPGRHPWHEAGVYYIQEASAMAPAAFLDVKPGERVLDLCAAPGGKSAQLGAALRGEGVLVCNEIHSVRVKTLSENIERMGLPNAVVTNEPPGRLAERFASWFDAVLVDAPCSGEGMFRRKEEAVTEWSGQNVEMCAARQDEILDEAAKMLAPGGRLVYSTCTFAPQEDEGSVSRFLSRHPDFFLEETKKWPGMENGRREWADWGSAKQACGGSACGTARYPLEKTVRLWPHRLAGEGHFAALMRREGGPGRTRGENPFDGAKLSDGENLFGVKNLSGGSDPSDGKNPFDRRNPFGGKNLPDRKKSSQIKEAAKVWEQFAGQELKVRLSEEFRLYGEQLYLTPPGLPSLDGLRVPRPGLHLGSVKKDRFEPSHALALALSPGQVRRVYPLPDEGAAKDWIAGLALPADGEKGWYLVTVDGYGLGWGKLAGGILKNHYPKGLRKNL